MTGEEPCINEHESALDIIAKALKNQASAWDVRF